MRLSARWLCVWAALSGVSAWTGCSGGGASGRDEGTGIDPAQPGESQPDGSQGTEDGAGDGADSGTRAPDDTSSDAGAFESCKTACEPGECGHVNDGCGSTIDCGIESVCGAGHACRAGACVEIPAQCASASPADVCAGKACGIVGVGCNETIDCGKVHGGCDPSKAYCQDFTCHDLPISNPDNCPSLLTCETAQAQCGLASNGCGGTLDCGSAADACAPGQYCEGNVCKSPAVCTPSLSKAAACAGRCGFVSDGCAGSYDCSTDGAGPNGTHCAAEKVCMFGACVSPSDPPPSCNPGVVDANICSKVQGACGVFTDQCGRAVSCGTLCAASDEWCGGGAGRSDPHYGEIHGANLCGRPACTPLSDATVCGVPGPRGGELCGLVSKGCGQFADCGGCTKQGELCGIDAARPGECALPGCVARDIKAACTGVCGSVSDGCGKAYDCDKLDAASNCDKSRGEVCGGYGAPAGRCGAPPTCRPLTCAQAGASCGYASDGCGGVLDCRANADNLGCDAVSTCSGDPPTCKTSDPGNDDCIGEYCDALPSCANVTIRGRVVTPGYAVGNGTYANQFGVRNAVVYIPKNGSTPLPALVDGPSCDRCEDTDLGPVLNSAVTDALGDFSMTGAIPTGVPSFRLVIKSGKWRRVVMVDTTGMRCGTTTTLNVDLTRLPRHQRDGQAGTNIPKIAITTGSSDALECVFYKMGIDDAEFTMVGDTRGEGRINLFGNDGNALGGSRPVPTCSGKYGNNIPCSADNNYGCATNRPGCSLTYSAARSVAFVPEPELLADYGRMDNYDMMVLDCHGGDHLDDLEAAAGTTGKANVERFVNHGGRLFLTHWSKDWIEDNGTLDPAATFEGGGGGKSKLAALSYAGRGGDVARLPDFATWLDTFATDTTGRWSADGSTLFDLPIEGQNGLIDWINPQGVDEWLFQDDESTEATQTFSFNTPLLQTPAGQPWCEAEAGDKHCKDCGRVTYSVFHVTEKGDSAGSSIAQVCSARAPMTTQEKVLLYMLFDLAACTGGVIQPPECVPTADESICQPPTEGPDTGLIACGTHGDGCGGTKNCGQVCPGGTYCSTGYCRPIGCTPHTCASLGFECGAHADGCGGQLTCKQTTCSSAQNCVDGCDDQVVDQICGLKNTGRCDVPQCTPQTVCKVNDDTDALCGLVSNGCGLVDCGRCPQGQACGTTELNRCGVGTCTPKTCDDLRADTARFPHGIECGELSDGCGGIAREMDGTLGCGICTLPASCNGGGLTPYQCSEPSCTPKTCDNLRGDTVQFPSGLECGFHSDGCGGIARDADGELGCGACPQNTQCGAGGTGLCGGACVPKTCAQVIKPPAGKEDCGFVNNGCALVDCGGCTQPGDVCGAESPNVCDPGYSCEKKTCAEMAALLGRAIECGSVSDGCGGAQFCGDCPIPGETCGGAGVPNRCGGGEIVCEDKRSCAEILGVSDTTEAASLCGQVGNDCGEIVACGVCPTGFACGAKEPYHCACVPATWDQACGARGYQCGKAPDGCGGTVRCGTCDGNAVCTEEQQCEPVEVI